MNIKCKFFLAIFFFLPIFLFAQNNPTHTTSTPVQQRSVRKPVKLTPEEKAKQQSESLSKSLSLTDVQKSKIQKVILEHEIEMEKMKNNKIMTTAERQQLTNKLNTNRIESFKKIMDAEQFRAYRLSFP